MPAGASLLPEPIPARVKVVLVGDASRTSSWPSAIPTSD